MSLFDGEYGAVIATGATTPEQDIEIRMQQFVNRWVFLRHQRAVALVELRELITEAKGRRTVHDE